MWTYTARPNASVRRAVVPLFAVLLAAGAEHVRALPTDSDQPIEIAADRAEHDDVKRITIYRGGRGHRPGQPAHHRRHRHHPLRSIRRRGEDDRGRGARPLPSVGRRGHRQPQGVGAADGVLSRAGPHHAARSGPLREDGSHVQADRLVYDSRKARFKALTDTGSEDEGTAGKTPERVRIEIKPKKQSQ